MTVCRIEATRAGALAAYCKAVTIAEAWTGVETIRVRHVGMPTYTHGPSGWRVAWTAEAL